MADWQWFGKLHTACYRATGGVLGGNLVGLPILLLTTTGRKSGQPRTTPLPFLRDAERLVIVGSNNGNSSHPHWWLNLRVCASAEIQLMRDRFRAEASLAAGTERERLWPALIAFNPPFERYRKLTERELPVVVLERDS